MEKYFVLKKEYTDAFMNASNERLGKAVSTICEYVFDGKEPVFEDESMKTWWDWVKKDLEIGNK